MHLKKAHAYIYINKTRNNKNCQRNRHMPQLLLFPSYCTRFHSFHFGCFRVMLWASFKSSN